jgi:hypothetical protein
VGYHPNLTRYPFNTFPQGLSWYGEAAVATRFPDGSLSTGSFAHAGP